MAVQGRPREDVDLTAEKTLQRIAKGRLVEEVGILVEIDQKVDVAGGTRIPPGKGPEDGCPTGFVRPEDPQEKRFSGCG